jgi:hypothetical protein
VRANSSATPGQADRHFALGAAAYWGYLCHKNRNAREVGQLLNSNPEVVSTDIVFRLLVEDGPDRAVAASLTYVPQDPYAVRVGFHTGIDETVEWTFARSLLSDGVTHPVGDGDVQVWPTDEAKQSGVCVALSSPSGQALFEAPLPRVVQFLTKTYAIVPTGSESGFVDVDAELALLLSGES